MVHSYCMTARIILDQSINCKICESQYNLFVKEEALCSGMTSSLFLRYLFFLGTITAFTTCILIADGMLKTAKEQSNPKGRKADKSDP